MANVTTHTSLHRYHRTNNIAMAGLSGARVLVEHALAQSSYRPILNEYNA